MRDIVCLRRVLKGATLRLTAVTGSDAPKASFRLDERAVRALISPPLNRVLGARNHAPAQRRASTTLSVFTRTIIMPIKVGDRLPAAKFGVMAGGKPATKTTDDVFKGKKVVLFAVPGAFTPTCHLKHLPGFLTHAAEFKAKGVDTIAVTGVNDVFVMDAWAKSTGGEGKLEYLADGSGDFAKAIDLALDASGVGLGVRSQRYAMLVEDGVVKLLNVEPEAPKADASSAEALLKQM